MPRGFGTGRGRREPLRVEPDGGRLRLDAGVKALASIGDPLCQIIGKTDYALRKASEEHAHRNALDRQGRRARSRAEALCPSVNLAETALWVEDEGDGVFHRVNIHARAHRSSANDRPIDVPSSATTPDSLPVGSADLETPSAVAACCRST